MPGRGRHESLQWSLFARAHHVFLCFFFARAEYCCNGTVVEDKELGKVIQLQGDQRKNVSAFLISNELAKKDSIKVHGF